MCADVNYNASFVHKWLVTAAKKRPEHKFKGVSVSVIVYDILRFIDPQLNAYIKSVSFNRMAADA